MKKSIAVVLILTLALSLMFTGCGSSEQFVTITSGGTGGTYYPIGGAIAKAITDNAENITVTGQAGNASVANCNLINEGETQAALAQNNVAYWAYNGEGSFEGTPITKIAGIASLYPEAIQLVALAESGITSVADLKGKKVCVGEAGSGVYADVVNILAAYGMTVDDIKADYLSFSEGSQKLKDKQIDAAFLTAGYPTSAVVDVATSRDITIVPMDEATLDSLIAASPYYAKAVIPAGTYKGVDVDTVTATTMAMLICSTELEEDLVYTMTKAMWENQNVIAEAHEKGKVVTMETALDGMGIPLHPGAAKYYKEQGLVD